MPFRNNATLREWFDTYIHLCLCLYCLYTAQELLYWHGIDKSALKVHVNSFSNKYFYFTGDYFYQVDIKIQIIVIHGALFTCDIYNVNCKRFCLK